MLPEASISSYYILLLTPDYMLSCSSRVHKLCEPGYPAGNIFSPPQFHALIGTGNT